MATSILARCVNLSLRSSTLLAKFVLVFFLAYYLDPMDVAVYGLTVATISYSLYALGFDFYTYSTRELLALDPSRWAGLLRDQGVFFALAYLIVLPTLSLVFITGLLPWQIAPWFFMLVVLEHLGQEINRLLVAISRPLLASTALFLRAGLWVMGVALAFWLWPATRSLESVFLAWSCGASAACLLGAVGLYRLDRVSPRRNVDWLWIRRGIQVALPFVVATLAVRGVFTLDRYWVREVAGVEVLAAYVLFTGVANAVMAFLEAGVFVFLYPKLILAVTRNDRNGFRQCMQMLLYQTLGVTLALGVLAALLIHPVLAWLDKPVYEANIPLLYVLLSAVAINAASMVPHYGLYAMSRDRHIIGSHILTLLVFVLLAYTLTRWTVAYGVPLALCGALGVMLTYKTIAYFRYSTRHVWAIS